MVCFVCLSVSLMIWWLLLLLLIIPHRAHCINITYTHCSTLYLLLRLIFLYILYFFIFISDSLENIKNHWVQFKAHTQTYTHTHTQKEMLIIFASFIIKQVFFYVNAKKLSSKWERMTFFWRQKTESGSLRITARPLLNYPRSATHLLPNNYSLCGCGCSRICYTKCTKYRKVNLCLNVFLDFLKK